jgi:hypothetical protein
MSNDELIDTTEHCVCGRTDGLVKGWCPACLPGAIDDLDAAVSGCRRRKE